MKVILLITVFAGFALGFFFVPGAYYDGTDGLTLLGSFGHGDTTNYSALEFRFAPDTNALRSRLELRLPIMGEGTRLSAKFVSATIPRDPRKDSLTVLDTIRFPYENAKEFTVRCEQYFQAGLTTIWGIFADYRQGEYEGPYGRRRLNELDTTLTIEKTKSQYIGGGLSYIYDTRSGDWDLFDEGGYVFRIEVGGYYSPMDTIGVDYPSIDKNSAKYAGYLHVEQLTYTPASALPVEIPVLTVSIPTVITTHISLGRFILLDENKEQVPQILAFKSSDFEFFRAVQPSRLCGYGYFHLGVDFRISPITRMYTPMTALHFLAPTFIPDRRADIEFIPFIDYGKIYGARPEMQIFQWGLGLGMRFGPRLTVRFDFAHCPTMKGWTTYMMIRQPFY